METQVEHKNTQTSPPGEAHDKPATRSRRLIRPAHRSFTVDGGRRLEVDLPGINRDTLTLDIDKSTLSLKALRHQAPADGYEFLEGNGHDINYELALQLGSAVDTERITATWECGALEVDLPNKAEQQPRLIEVQ